jgi:hypothetical protein
MTPGLARSMKCGITPWLPSGRFVTEVGTQAAACGMVGSTRPPTLSARRRPSPVLAVGEGVKCSVPGRVREELRAPARQVVREAAAGQHHAAPGTHQHALALALDDGALDAVVLDQQLLDRALQPHRDAEVHRRLGQPAGQRVAVGQRHAAAVLQHVERMRARRLRDEDEGFQRAEGAHEVADLRARAEHHAEHGELGQRRRQQLDALAQFAAVEGPRDHRAPALLRRPAPRRGSRGRPPACRTARRSWR